MRNSISVGVVACFLLFGCSKSEQPAPKSKVVDKSASAKTEGTQESPQKLDPQKTMEQVRAYFEQGNYRAAFPLLNQLHTQKNCPAEGYAIRAQILDHSGLTSQAISSLTIALTKDKDRADWHNMLGLLLVKVKKLPLAQQAFTKAVEIDPNFSKAYNNRGLMYIAMQEFGTAINDFNKAIQTSPEYVDAYNNRGYAYLEMGNYSKAIENFTRSITLQPDYVKGYNNRGFALIKMGNAEQAIEDFTKAIELSPYTVKHYLHRRDAWLAMKNEKAAEQDLKRAQWVQKLILISNKISRDDKNAELFVERARHFLEGGEYDKALEDVALALKRDKTLSRAYTTKAKIQFARKEYQPAIASCTQALEFGPDYEASSLRGDAYLAIGKIDEAIADYETAKRFDWEVAKAFWKRADIRKKKGDTAGAKADRATALKLDPQIEKRITR